MAIIGNIPYFQTNPYMNRWEKETLSHKKRSFWSWFLYEADNNSNFWGSMMEGFTRKVEAGSNELTGSNQRHPTLGGKTNDILGTLPNPTKHWMLTNKTKKWAILASMDGKGFREGWETHQRLATDRQFVDTSVVPLSVQSSKR